MNKINLNERLNKYGGKGLMAYPWNNVIYASIGMQSINSLLSLTNQIVYNNNDNPLYKTSTMYDNTSSRMYLRAGKNALSTTMSFGSPIF